jgi:outer membrane biosynthesis protein TonB
LCCLPRPDPICTPCGGRSGGSSEPEVAKPKSKPKPKPKPKEKPNAKEKPQEAAAAEDYDYDSDIVDEDNPVDVEGNEKYGDEYDAAPAEGASRVEVKEKTFPDGSRVVEETTIFADGSKSVKTQTYDCE